MEQALCDVLKDVRLGKILIQTNLETEEPEVSFVFGIELQSNIAGAID
jgi:uridine kinase